MKTFDRADYTRKSEAAIAPIAPRPRVLKADRSGIAASVPQPPATWTPPPQGAPREVPHENEVLGQWPGALAERHGVIFSYEFTMQPIPGIGERGRLVMSAQRVDLRTGKKVGAVKKLWPLIAKPDRHHATQPDQVPTPLAALTSDGNRLALRDPAEPARLDIWAEDFSRVGGLKPYGDVAVDWLGWSADGKLLVISGGALTAWDIESGKAYYEVKGGYRGPADYGPGRKWLAVAADEAVDLIDLGSGKCLGRFRRDGAGLLFLSVAVAPDGKSLSAVRPGVTAPRPGTRNPTAYVADLWDLTTGRATSVPFGETFLQVDSWSTPRHLLAASGMNVALIDASLPELPRSVVLPGM